MSGAGPPQGPRQPPASTRGFWALLFAQYTSAFNENCLKFLVMYLLLASGLSDQTRDNLISVVLVVFAAPFILFSMTGGWLADRFSKRSVTVGTKWMEAAVMALAMVGLGFNLLPLKIAAVFLLSTQAALFSATKYGSLPELLPEERLSWGNGVLELATFLAIITGTMAAGILAEHFRGQQHWSGMILLGFTAAGLLASFAIPRLRAVEPAKAYRPNFVADVWREIRHMQPDRVLWFAVLGNTYFFFLGALVQPLIILYGSDVLGLRATQNSYLQAALAIGIGVGSLAAGYVSMNKIEYGLIPLGALGMTVFSGLLALRGLTPLAFGALLAGLGFFGGFYAVPINAMIQHRPEDNRRGATIATSGVLSWVGILIAAGAYKVLLAMLHLEPRQIFLIGAGLTILAAGYTCWLLPDSLLRLVLWFATITVYRIRVRGRENLPQRGGALLVSNHMSWVDALLLTAASERPIRFLMFKDIYEHPLVYPFARLARAIPISSQLRPRDMIRSLREASDAIRAGEVVCIFAEGQITRVGHLLPFRRGFERIMKGVEAPIVPVALDGVWGSIFSFERGRFLWKMPKKIPYPVVVSFGTPLPPTSTALDVRQAVEDLSADSAAQRMRSLPSLDAEIVRTARSHPFRFAMADGQRGTVRFGAALTGAVLLARRLRRVWQG